MRRRPALTLLTLWVVALYVALMVTLGWSNTALYVIVGLAIFTAGCWSGRHWGQPPPPPPF